MLRTDLPRMPLSCVLRRQLPLSAHGTTINLHTYFGITLDAGKRYTQTVETSFHISCAALEVAAADGPKQRAALMLQHEKVEFLLCTLDNKHFYQQALDLNFTEGEEVCFFVNGQGIVHLTGYLVPEDTNDGEFGDYSADMGTSDDDDTDDDDDAEESDEEIPMLEELTEPRSSKRKKSTEEAAPNKKQKKAPEPEENEDDEDSDEDPDFLEMDLDLADSGSDDSDDDEDEDDSDDDDEDDDSDEEEEEEESGNDLSGSFIQEKSKKEKTPNKDATPAKAEKTPKSGKTPKQEQSPKSEKKVKGKQEENVKQKTPKAAKAAEAVATPNTEGKKKKQQQESPAPKAAANGATPNTEGKKKKKKQKQEESPAPKAAANVATPNTEGKKKKKQQDNQENKAAANVATPNTEGKKKKKQQDNQENKQTPKKAKKVVLPGGTVVEDIKEGHGPEAKPGKMVHVYYKGTMKDGSVFDAVTSGKPFKFKLGKQEVIKGWDMGLQGMKVGSKRKLTVPPGQAYGSQRVGKIGANSTLFFDVELKAVS